MDTWTTKWVAKFSRVREVSLLGTANLAYWKELLEKEQVSPLENDGRAQVVIIAADPRFKGVSFKELSFSILVAARKNGITRQEFFLIQSFNSRRIFAYCERLLFATPYYHGDVRVSATVPASIQLVHARQLHFRAEMQGGAVASPPRQPLHCREEVWEGAVFLPATGQRNSRPGNYSSRESKAKPEPIHSSVPGTHVRSFQLKEVRSWCARRGRFRPYRVDHSRRCHARENEDLQESGSVCTCELKKSGR